MNTGNVPVQIYSKVVKLRRIGLTPTIEPDGDGRWVLLVNEEKSGLQISLGIEFRHKPSGRYAQQVELVIDDEKIEARDLTEALKLMMRRIDKIDTGASTVSGASGAARSNSVETRRASVIRV